MFSKVFTTAAKATNGTNIIKKELSRSISVSAVQNAKIGFVGVGSMGSNMCSNLQKNGHQLVLCDTNQQALKPFADLGAEIVQTPADVVSRVDRVVTMVPTPKHVLDVYLGTNGLISSGKATKGSILMDSSTIDPETAKTVAKEAEAAGLKFLDSPVTGAVPAARAGTLTFMVGGEKETVDAVRELLLSMGKNVIHTGPTGTGQVAKICNNMLLAVTMVGTGEALNLGKRMGLDPALLTEILNISSGRSWVSEIYNPVPGIGDGQLPSNNDYKPGFQVRLMAKDLTLAQSMSVQSQSPTPMGSLALQVYRMMTNNGFGDKDFSFPYQFLKEESDK